MQYLTFTKFPASILLILVVTLAACSTISSYDQAAYSQATSTKVDALALMSKATGSYDSHRKDIEAVTLEMDKAYEYEKGRGLNEITVNQWDILRGPERDLFGGFLKRWREKGSLNPFFIEEKKKQVAEAFDQIIQLEGKKNR